jgi:AAA domain-containing protein/DnaB helicase-like protein/MarR family protein
MSVDFMADEPLPQNLEAERAILGSILLGGPGTDEAFAGIQEADFFITAHQVIFRHMKLLFEKGTPTNDPLLLCESLQVTGHLDAAGGVGYICQLPDGLPRVSNIGYYTEIVVMKSHLRAQARIAERILEMALGANGDVHEVLQQIAILSAPLREEVRQKPIMEFMSAAEFAAAADEPIEWISKGYVAKGAITEIGAKVKAGKTTLITELVRAAADGAPFLGQPTLKTPTVYLTEQPAVSFRQTMKRAGLLGRDDFRFLLRSKVLRMSWPEVVAATIAECKRVGAHLLVVDTLPQFAGLSGDAENNSGDALAVMQPLQQAAAQGIGVILVRHQRKAGGDVGDCGRGSSAFAGAVDVVVSLRRPDGNARNTVRVLHALSRFSETPAELRIELTSNGYVSLGEPSETCLETAKASILAALPTSEGGALNMTELKRRVQVSRSTAQSAIDELVEEGSLIRVGEGRRGRPFRYFRTGN